MTKKLKLARPRTVAGFLLFAAAVSLCLPPGAAAQRYQRNNLVSDIPGVALRSDPNLVNPWGIAFSPGAPIWIANNNSGISTLYTADGQPFPAGSPLVVIIPPPPGSPNGTIGSPTGIVVVSGNGFVVTANGQSGSSAFIFASEDGTISGWSPSVDFTHAILAVDNSAGGTGAVYKGLAIAEQKGREFLYAANFRAGLVEVYNEKFHQVNTFTDPNLPAGYAPFGIHNINGKLWVTFALQNASKHDDVPGYGHGFVDVFDLAGHLLHQFAMHGALNSPWGVALAPAHFGKFSGAILIGNFGNGWINAYHPITGQFLGPLQDTLGQPMEIQKLWSLKFGAGDNFSGPVNRLLFTAGIGNEAHGLMGTLDPFSENEDDK